MEFLLSIELWERAYIDLWSIPHLFFGFVSFYLLSKTKIKKISAFLVVIFVAILWEIFEQFTPVQEYLTNVITDIVLAGVGFLLADLTKKIKPQKDNLILKISLIIFFVSNLLGYLASFIRNY